MRVQDIRVKLVEERASHLNALSGAQMDAPLAPQRIKRVYFVGSGCLFVLALVAVWWLWVPSGLAVAAEQIKLATAGNGVFLDQLVLRTNVAPLKSVILDSVEAGRVEEVLAVDGAQVNVGQPLFRLSNSQRQLELLARQSDHAQQLSNLSNLRVSLESSRVDHQRRLSELEYAVAQAEKQKIRNEKLAATGFLSPVILEESSDRLTQQTRALTDERQGAQLELATKRNAIVQMEKAIGRLESGLKLVNANVAALSVEASVTGRLTDFSLQVGATVQQGQRIGRIDDPVRVKLLAQVDEYYLSRVTVGLKGSVNIEGKFYPISVSHIFPQIKEQRFGIELTFIDNHPESLKPGQGLDAILPLGQSMPALLLPMGAFINDSGGSWVFVVSSSGNSAVRRAIKVGRRSNTQVEIDSGLNPGEQVIISSYSPFGSATTLQITR